jgi:cysteinyl-tRNA synthetase
MDNDMPTRATARVFRCHKYNPNPTTANFRDATVGRHKLARAGGQDEKRNAVDFGLGKKAAEHIMRWASPWSEGFPAGMRMHGHGQKYLGAHFDIHGEA